MFRMKQFVLPASPSFEGFAFIVSVARASFRATLRIPVQGGESYPRKVGKRCPSLGGGEVLARLLEKRGAATYNSTIYFRGKKPGGGAGFRRMMDANVQQKLGVLPDRPGAYIFKDERGEVLYVGKAVSLRNRVRSYFQEGGGHSPRTRVMVPRVRDIDTIVTDTEVEALILECNLIKKHRPHYNVRLRDDK